MELDETTTLDFASLIGGPNEEDEQEEIDLENKEVEILVKPDINSIRFHMELEFVQLLANPTYLQYLSHEEYFNKPEFKNYLKYLKYWNTKPYNTFIIYPYCLEILNMIQNPKWHTILSDPKFITWLHKEEFKGWKLSNEDN